MKSRSPVRFTCLIAGTLLAAYLAAPLAEARLAVRPPAPPPTQPTPTPDSGGGGGPTPVVPPGDIDLCRDSIRTGMRSLADKAAQFYGACAQKGFDCLLTASASLCCARSVEACRDDLAELERVRGNFRLRFETGRCQNLPFSDLIDEDQLDLGSIADACLRLDPAGDPLDVSNLADCMDRLLTEDVFQRVTSYDVPRSDEAFDCLGIEPDELPTSIGADPATCLPPPPTPTPFLPPPTPTPGPTPTPSPGPDGCQPALGGPCDDGTFTHCCSENMNCAPAFISPSIGGFCFAGAPTPTPVPTATPDGSPTPDATATPDGSPTPDPTPTPDPGPTPTPTPGGPTPTPGGPTPDATPTPTLGMCTSVTVRISIDYTSNEASGSLANLQYSSAVSLPGTGNASSVIGRVTQLAQAAGIFNVADNDGTIPYTLTVGLVAIPGPIPAGAFADVVFDCESGLPTLGDFACTPEVSNLLGADIDATCSLALTVTP